MMNRFLVAMLCAVLMTGSLYAQSGAGTSTLPVTGAGAGVVPAAPPAPPAAPALPGSQLVSELKLLQSQVGNVQGKVTEVTANVKPVTESLKKIVAIGESYPKQVSEFKAKYDIPANASVADELQGVGRAMMEKAGLDPKQSSMLTKSLAGAQERAKAFKPFTPESIMLSVGITAGMNVLGQLAADGNVDLKKSVSFLGDKGFWGGLVGSGVGYSLAALAISRFLPPGFGGPVAAFLPTFGALAGAFLGGELGTRALSGGGLKDALSQISISEILAQSAGSTIGMFAGAHLFTSVAAGMGSFAGPLGSIVGGIVGASLARAAMRTVKSMITGESAGDDAAVPDVTASGTRSPQSLPGTAILPAADLKQIQEDYRNEYAAFILAEQKGDKASRTRSHERLQKMTKDYELAVRSMVRGMSESGHTPPTK